jgi:hypothetical protein
MATQKVSAIGKFIIIICWVLRKEKIKSNNNLNFELQGLFFLCVDVQG